MTTDVENYQTNYFVKYTSAINFVSFSSELYAFKSLHPIAPILFPCNHMFDITTSTHHRK